jgi:hypothetical protein
MKKVIKLEMIVVNDMIHTINEIESLATYYINYDSATILDTHYISDMYYCYPGMNEYSKKKKEYINLCKHFNIVDNDDNYDNNDVIDDNYDNAKYHHIKKINCGTCFPFFRLNHYFFNSFTQNMRNMFNGSNAIPIVVRDTKTIKLVTASFTVLFDNLLDNDAMIIDELNKNVIGKYSLHEPEEYISMDSNIFIFGNTHDKHIEMNVNTSEIKRRHNNLNDEKYSKKIKINHEDSKNDKYKDDRSSSLEVLHEINTHDDIITIAMPSFTVIDDATIEIMNIDKHTFEDDSPKQLTNEDKKIYGSFDIDISKQLINGDEKRYGSTDVDNAKQSYISNTIVSLEDTILETNDKINNIISHKSSDAFECNKNNSNVENTTQISKFDKVDTSIATDDYLIPRLSHLSVNKKKSSSSLPSSLTSSLTSSTNKSSHKNEHSDENNKKGYMKNKLKKIITNQQDNNDDETIYSLSTNESSLTCESSTSIKSDISNISDKKKITIANDDLIPRLNAK